MKKDKKIQIVKMELMQHLRISLNDIYAGSHWRNRQKLKQSYLQWFLQYKNLFQKIENPCKIEYNFHFRTYPMDHDNTVFMAKMITDCLVFNGIIKDDTYKHILKGSYTSKKTPEPDHIILKIEEL